MNKVFYGLWISRDTNPNDIIETGIWENKFSNKERIPKQMAKFKIGDEVFLYQGIEDVKVEDTPFFQFVSGNYLYKNNTLVKVKCWAIGKIKKINENSLEIDWNKNYTPNEWYAYFRQDGAWEIELNGKNNQQQKKYQELYKMAFEGKKQDYKWWFKNGILKRKNKTQKEESMNSNNIINTFKNIILYGAPGVGKTHNINKLITLLEEGKSDVEIFKTIKENKYLKNPNISNFKDRVKFVTFHQSFGYEDFIEGFRPNQEGKIELVDGIFKNICDDAKNNKTQNYYLIIDEINRGNISKIFGELITLIEEDKRDTLEVILPYSKQPLKVPSNLYIIGTMNSTDKSIALIDIALRRRFTFLKMKPNPELIKHRKAKEIFENLNNHISKTLGDDFKIGHSYFMNIQNDDELNFVLEYKIKPLLEEYFYGNDDDLNIAINMIKNM